MTHEYTKVCNHCKKTTFYKCTECDAECIGKYDFHVEEGICFSCRRKQDVNKEGRKMHTLFVECTICEDEKEDHTFETGQDYPAVEHIKATCVSCKRKMEEENWDGPMTKLFKEKTKEIQLFSCLNQYDCQLCDNMSLTDCLLKMYKVNADQ